MLTKKFKRSANEISAKAERPEGRDATKWASQTSYETAKEIVNSKAVMTRAAFDKLAPELKPYAFCISGVEDAQMLQDIRGIVADWTANTHGQHWADAKAEIAQKLSSLPNFSEEKARRRAELLLRTHGADAMCVGQWELAQQTKSFLPYFKYLCTQDGKTRPMHRKLHGLVLPVDHKFWDTHMPPAWDWGCRCQVVQISEAKMLKQREAEKRVPPENRRVLDEKQQELLAKNNELWLSPTEKLAITSSKNVPSCKSLYMNSDEILKKFDPDIREALLKKLESVKCEEFFGDISARDWFEHKRPLITKKNYIDMTLEEKMAEMDYVVDEYKKYSIKLYGNKEIEEIGREIFKLPMSKQGSVVFGGKYGKAEFAKDIISEAFSELEMFVNGSLLNNEVNFDLGYELGPERSYYYKGIIHIAREDKNAIHVCHEYMHFIEEKYSDVLEKCVEFLKKRAGNEKLKTLNKIIGKPNYGRSEKAFEDSWVKNGGDAYSGKYYKDYCATEVLSMGMERFLKNPILFYKQDKEYFNFVLGVIQGV